MASVMSALAEFEGDLLRERVRSGVAAAQARGVVFGRRPGQRTKSDRLAPKVLGWCLLDTLIDKSVGWSI